MIFLMRSFFRWFFVCMIKFFFLLGWLNSSSSHAEEKSSLRLRALLLVPGGTVATLHLMAGETVGQAVLIGARGLSEPFRAPARLFSLAVPDKSQPIGYRALGNVTLPEQGDDFILLLEPVKDTFRAHVILAKESRFDADALLFFNASDVVIGASLGGSKVIIPPRKSVFGKPPAQGEKPFYQVTFYYQEEGNVRPFYDTRWPHRKDSRCYIFFYRGESGRLTYQSVDERIMPDVKGDEPATP
ncbi:MAG: hypothetical protein RI957_889 [Verrucomicrobiota bacterium]|jgi:hypothetical protein